jgi:hypothetical protein
MIVTEIYNGQGLGNQLACYITTRVVAKDLGYDFGIMNAHKFKCLDFMDLDFGLPVAGGSGREGGPPDTLPDGIQHYFKEKWLILPNGSNVTIDDPNLELIQDKTKIDGIFQSEDRIIHRKDEIRQWLKIKPEKDCYDYSDPNICIINYRGGEYAGVTHFHLNGKYWDDAIVRMRRINPNFRFVVISDDVERASRQFQDFEVKHFDIATDFSIIKNAHYLILSNSSFPYFATLLSDTVKYILAPKYWGRYNISNGYWSCGYNIYRNHNYLDRDGNLFTWAECVVEHDDYKKRTGIYE